MKLLEKLQSPLALVVQGFVVGACLFLLFEPLSSAATSSPSAAGSVLSDLQV